MSSVCRSLLLYVTQMRRRVTFARDTQVRLESAASRRNVTAVTVFTVVGGVLQEREGPAPRHERHARTPVQQGKGHWVWQVGPGSFLFIT